VVLASSKYHSSGQVVSIVAAGLLIYATLAFVASGLLIYKKTLTLVVRVACAAAVNLTLNVILLPIMGIQGAAIATLLGYAFCILLLSHGSCRILPLQLDVSAMGWYLCAGALSVIASLRVEMARPLLNVVVRSVLALVVYFGCLALTNHRVRSLAIGL